MKLSFRPALRLLPALLLLGCARSPATGPASRYAATPPVIDGQTTDWADSLRDDPASRLRYQVLNDQRTVYLRLLAADPATQAKLLRYGLVVWLDTTGRNQRQLGVRYPLGGPPPGPDNAPGAAPPDRRTQLTQALAGLREMELLNYQGSKEPTLTDALSPLGVKAALGYDAQENLVYELAVPLRLLYRRLPALGTGAAAVVGLTLDGGRLPATGAAQTPSEYDARGASGMQSGRSYGYGPYGGRYPGTDAAPIVLKINARLSGK